jgi:8-oxo-dGTP pyrophosphatase MutT (NUDIX family)
MVDAPLSEVETRVRDVLSKPLPGLDVQSRLAPRPPANWRPGFSTARTRPAAGLVLLYPHNGVVTLPLTVRSGTLRRHGGQVSLPGGVVDPDETPEQAALREAVEEIGLLPGSARTLGRLSPLDIPVSGFRLQPVVAVTEIRPEFRLAEMEVDRILEVPLALLADPAVVKETQLERDGRIVDVPYFDVEGCQVWGATAMVLAELLWVLGVRGRLDPLSAGGYRPTP